MGWANCGADSKGRPIGYAHAGTCDAEGCNAAIDRGLSYACGGMHGDDDPPGSCEGYFCERHLYVVRVKEISPYGRQVISVCPACYEAGRREGLWVEEETEGK